MFPLRLLLALALAVGSCAAPTVSGPPSPRFVAIALGAGGGPGQDDLSAYLLAPAGSSDYVALDAGTLLAGIKKAWNAGSFRDLRPPADATLAPEGWILRERVKAYLISHGHLDHVAGLIVDSPEDGSKAILGLPSTIDVIRDHLFNRRAWPNFGDEGEGALKKYRYARLEPGRAQAIAGTAMSVEPFVLSHASVVSTAFLIGGGGAAALYFGDTGPDAVEGSDRLSAVWTRIAPLVRDGTLRGIFIEVSYPDGRPDHLLFGHLTPAWLMHELRRLAERVDPTNPAQALRRLTVVVTHIKPSLNTGPSPRERIAGQLAERNDLGVRLHVAEQGQRIEF